MKQHIENLLATAIAQVLQQAGAHVEPLPDPEVGHARDPRHGHFASNIAMRLAKTLGRPPRQIAEAIIAALPQSDQVQGVEIAGPGFINFRLADRAFHRELETIIQSGATYGQSQMGNGTRVLLEFVSANPTGPLHVGHGRHAAFGASLAAILKAAGYAVHSEYYVNDAGRQMDILATSLWLRMIELAGTPVAFPAAAYQGGYLIDIARDETAELDNSFRSLPAGLLDGLPADEPDRQLDMLIQRARENLGVDGFRRVLKIVLSSILGDIRNDLEEFGTVYDEWFSEQSLSDSGAVQHALDLLAKNGVTYQKDGAIWFRATDYGDEKDRVVIRENGRTTYFASDIAYHLQKRERGFDLLLNVLGADHHGYVARVRAGLQAMGQPPESLEVQLVQFVTLYRGSEKVQMSTRSGEFVTLRQLRAEVGNDAARLFFVMRSNEQHLDFDLELAKSHSNDNPVYYLQYANARVCSVLRGLAERGLNYDAASARQNLHLLTAEQEQLLLQTLARFPQAVEAAAAQRAPQHIVHYLRELAQAFHTLYNAHRFIVDDAGLRNARLMLGLATGQVIRNGLGLLGVSAPEAM